MVVALPSVRLCSMLAPASVLWLPTARCSISKQTTPFGKTPSPSRIADPGPLCAAHTPNFPALLRQLGASLLVTTYQAGKLVMVRDEGDHLNTHFRAFQAPMGLALADGGRLAIGTTHPGLGVPRRPGRRPPARARRPARRLLPAALQPRHRQHPDPRDGLRRRRRALVRQHPLLLPLHARPPASFVPRWRPPFVTRAGAVRPLPPQRPGDGRRPAEVRHRPGRDGRRRPAGGRTRPGAAS